MGSVILGASSYVCGPRPGAEPTLADRHCSLSCSAQANAAAKGLKPRLARLTDDPSADKGSSRSPDGKQIAFFSGRDGKPEIYVMNAVGSEPQRLTDKPAGDCQAAWSPDSKQIAFASERDGNPEIYVMNADGSGVQWLTNDPAAAFGPSWSPNGKKLAFGSDRDGDFEIYVINADGSGLQQLTDNAPGFAAAIDSSATCFGVIGRCGVIVGVWIEWVTAQVMMTFLVGAAIAT